MLTSARDLLVVGVERLPAAGPDIGGSERDDEEHDREHHGRGSIDAWQEPFAKGEVERRREYEGRGDDQNPVQAMPRWRLVAGGHPPEVEREGGGKHEQDEREGGWALALEAEDTGEDRREYPLYHE